jgi:hypothetical protein
MGYYSFCPSSYQQIEGGRAFIFQNEQNDTIEQWCLPFLSISRETVEKVLLVRAISH